MNAIVFMRWLRAVLALLCCAGCGERASAGSSPASDTTPLFSPPAPARSHSETPSDARTTAPLAEVPPPDCPTAVPVPPRALATEWPARLGQRVRLSCRVVRALDFATYLVAADGAQFVVLAEPESPPCRPSTSLFIITGAARVHDHGRTSLPELVVDTCGQ